MNKLTDNQVRILALVKVLHRKRLLPNPDAMPCAICGHADCSKEIVRNSLTDEPVCWVCHMELEWFAHGSRRRTRRAIDAIEVLSGKPWSECRLLLLKDSLDHLQELIRNMNRLGLIDDYRFACPGREGGATIGEQIRIVEELLNPLNNIRR